MSDARRPNDGGGPVSYRRHNVHHRLGEAAATSSHHKLAAAPPRRSEANWLPSRSGCRSTPCRTCPAATDADTGNAAVCADAGDTPSPSTTSCHVGLLHAGAAITAPPHPHTAGAVTPSWYDPTRSAASRMRAAITRSHAAAGRLQVVTQCCACCARTCAHRSSSAATHDACSATRHACSCCSASTSRCTAAILACLRRRDNLALTRFKARRADRASARARSSGVALGGRDATGSARRGRPRLRHAMVPRGALREHHGTGAGGGERTCASLVLCAVLRVGA